MAAVGGGGGGGGFSYCKYRTIYMEEGVKSNHIQEMERGRRVGCLEMGQGRIQAAIFLYLFFSALSVACSSLALRTGWT